MAVRVLAVLHEDGSTTLVDPQTPIARSDDAGLIRGDGCFEGCRVVAAPDGPAVAKLDAHLDRMAHSAAALGLDFDRGGWQRLVATACDAWDGGSATEAAMKLVLTRGSADAGVATAYLTIADLPTGYARQRREGLRVITLNRGTSSAAYTDAPWLLGGVKTLSYAVHMAALREAAGRGADEVIFVSVEGDVLESPVSSVVWAVGRTLLTTPSGPSGILPGTTQQLIFRAAAAAGWQTETTRASVDDLHAADVVWLIGSVRGPVDVVELDGKARTRQPQVDAEIRRLAGFPAA